MRPGRWTLALYGVVAAILGLALGDVVASIVAPAASPVLVVGSALIDLAPAPVKIAVIDWFGTADKPLLVALVILGTLALAGLAGLLSRDRPAVGVGIIGALTVLVVVLAASNSTFGTFGFLPALVTGGVTIGALLLLRQRHLDASDGTAGQGMDRRTIVISLGIAALAVLTGSVTRRRTSPVPATSVTLPKPVEPIAALPRGLGAPGITPLRTPMRDFYRVDTALRVPSVDAETWRLTIDGDVGRPVTITYRQLLAMPMIERDITLTCVSNPVGGPYAGGARWLGVRLTDLFERAGRGTGKADQILSTDVGGMTISTPLDAATDGRDAMLAVGMNGQPLPREHGYPARMVIPGLYGFISATKWIRRMTLTTYAAQEAYWTPRGWATHAPIKLASRIDTPRHQSKVESGEVIVGGIAWAPNDGGVGRVQVRVDDDPWRDATLGPSGGSDYWRQWFLRWDAPKGRHTLSVRTIGANGDVQTSTGAPPAPDGASGYHDVTVRVA